MAPDVGAPARTGASNGAKAPATAGGIGGKSRAWDSASGQGTKSWNNSTVSNSYNTTNNYYDNSYNYASYGNDYGWGGCGWNNPAWYGPSCYGPAYYGPSYYGGSGFGFSLGWSSWGGWNIGLGFGWSSGGWCGSNWGYSSWCAPAYYAPACYTPAYCGPWYGSSWCSPVWYGPAWYAPAPIVVAPAPFYTYPQTVVVTNYVERVVEVQVPNYVSIAPADQVSVDAGPSGYVVPSSASMAAWGALNSGDLGGAAFAFQDLLTLDPTDGRALMGRGIIYMLEGNQGMATASFRLAIGSDTGAISSLPISTALAQRVRDRAEQLWAEPVADSAFVAAVGYAIINEPQLAFRVATRAIELGDSTLTTAQLRSQLSYAQGNGS